MKLSKNILVIMLFVVGSINARSATRGSRLEPAMQIPVVSAQQPTEQEIQSSTQIVPAVLYARDAVEFLSKQLIDDLFMKKGTIELLVNQFKEKYPGPDKSSDMKILYNAIINNPDIKKLITLRNATSVYNFIQETMSNAWDKQDELIWSR